MKTPKKYILRYFSVFITMIFISGCSSCGSSKSGDAGQSAVMQKINVTIKTAGGQSYVVNSEVAVTDAQHEAGLMNRNTLGTNDGMLFVFQDAQTRYFWMKNTNIPLDMIFVGTDKIIVDINENTTPQSTVPYASAGPARYVLEVNGGYCASKNINIGDTLSFAGY
jgi:uncharacterized protein